MLVCTNLSCLHISDGWRWLCYTHVSIFCPEDHTSFTSTSWAPCSSFWTTLGERKCVRIAAGFPGSGSLLLQCQGLRAWPVTLGICGPLGGYFINNTVCSLYTLGKGKDHSPELRVMGEPRALVSHLLRHLC